MKFRVTVPPSLTLPTGLNRCGYATFRDPNTGQTSYVKRLGNFFYPRFHLYILNGETAKGGNEAQLSIHLDMKQPSYIPGKAHSGEYDGEQVETEARRIVAWFQGAVA